MRAIERTFRIGDLTIASKVWRAAEAPVTKRVLAIHGWTDNAASFDLLAPPLAKSGWEVVALDLPGHGLSGWRPRSQAYTAIDYAFNVLQLVHQEGWAKSGPFSIVGHSLGAGIASAVAAGLGESLSSLVLIEALGLFPRSPDDAASHFAAAGLRDAALVDRRPRVYPTVDDAVAARRAAVTAAPGDQSLSEEAARRLVLRGVVPATWVDECIARHGSWRYVAPSTPGDAAGTGAPGAMEDGGESGPVCFRHDRRLYLPNPAYLTEEQCRAYLRNPKCPRHVVLAEKGWPAGSEAMARRETEVFGKGEVTRVAGSHHPHVDPSSAVETSEVVLRFLSSSMAKL